MTRLLNRSDNGTYPPGSRVPGERDLAEQLEVSRVTIREAEIALQAINRLEIRTGSGVYVLDTMDQKIEVCQTSAPWSLNYNFNDLIYRSVEMDAAPREAGVESKLIPQVGIHCSH